MEQGLWGTDPPKVLSDVVEALIGAAHVDCGYKQGQKSANFVVQPMLKAIMSNEKMENATSTSSEENDDFLLLYHLITHPKQEMLVQCQYLKAKAVPSHEYVREKPGRNVWYGDKRKWGHCSETECNIVGEVTWNGLVLCSVADEKSRTVSRNRACALLSAVLRKYPELRSKLNQMSEKIAEQK